MLAQLRLSDDLAQSVKVLAGHTPCGRFTSVPKNWISFRLDPALHERMKAVAAAERRSMANWLATVVEKALNDAERDGS